jgi:penicillin-binding protein 1A
MKAFIKFISVIVSLGVLGSLGVLALIVYISFDLPQISSLADYNPPIPSKILSKDGEVLLEIGLQKREVVEFKDIPPKVINAFLAAEDDNFYQHKGVDYMGVARAMFRNILAGRIVQGGSTITQQVAKSLLLTRKKTITRKIKDFLLAQKIEEKFSKQDILFLYLNQVYLGGGYYGVKAAFRGYFDKDLSEATIAETALIAGLLVAPGRYSPYVKPRRAKMRQLYVLSRLFKTGKISHEAYIAAKSEKISIRLKRSSPLKGGHFTDWVKQKLVKKIGKDKFLTGGFEVVTTLNWELQKKAEKEVLDGVRRIDRRQGFKGPLASINEFEFIDFYKKQRNKILKSKSEYFIFDTDGTRKDEIIYDEESYTQLLKAKEEVLSIVDNKRRNKMQPGIQAADQVVSMIKPGDQLKAVVEYVNKKQRLIYLSYAGVSLVIPEKGYRWAHPREIKEERSSWQNVRDPNTVVKRGDIVLVKIIKVPQLVNEYFNKDFNSYLAKRKKIKEFYLTQKYFIAELDQAPEAEGALLSVNPHNGEVISLVGGADFTRSQFNRVTQSNRQPGSSFKPFIFAAALEHGFTPGSLLLDSPSALGGAGNGLDWKPRNYDGKFKGEMTFRRALEVSRNIPTIKLVQSVGVKKMIEFIRRLGITAKMPNDLSISLGSFGMNLSDLVRAYSTFPNNGKKISLKAISSVKDRYGKVYLLDDEVAQVDTIDPESALEVAADTQENTIDDKLSGSVNLVTKVEDGLKKISPIKILEGKDKINEFLVNLAGEQVYDRRLSYIMTNLLRGVVQNGTGRRARGVSSFIGGKTGTTNSYVDAWFLGFSTNIVTGVWTGFDNNKTLGWGETGSKSALPIWAAFMKDAIKKFGEEDFEAPAGIVNVLINKNSGALANSNTGDGIKLLESYVEGREPGKEEDRATKPDRDSQIIIDDDEYYSTQ